MNTTAHTKSRFTAPVRSASADRMSAQHRANILDDPRAAQLTHYEYLLMEKLLAFHEPTTGYMKSPTAAETLQKRLRCSASTLLRARRGLMARGLIRGYRPGTGYPGQNPTPSMYCIARSWEEAAEAAALRAADDAPYFPELPNRTPSRPGKSSASAPAEVDEDQEPAEVDEDQAPEETEEKARQAEEKRDRARLRRSNFQGPVPPKLPYSSELPQLAEIEQRRADPEAFEATLQRGSALLRAAYHEALDTMASKDAA